MSVETQHEKLLEKLAAAISAKHGINLKLKHFPASGYCLICYSSKLKETDGTYAAYEHPFGKLHFSTASELLGTLLACGKTFIYSSVDIADTVCINVAREFGTTLEEISINCDLLLQAPKS